MVLIFRISASSYISKTFVIPESIVCIDSTNLSRPSLLFESSFNNSDE